ncbi:MAG: prepilin-type N-terminal cleavage/methylation domain-containing protein [Puniceicoccales bacterium]|jgi:prepilin-type N-terminal cleavage/methylation domain-containing protein|nr:prepilin-type N-terminal cleavage/methylation domain-containing protein [Puniceicoccales bacterium]
MARLRSSKNKGFTLIEVSVSLAILLPAILLLTAFLTQWENRISRASFSTEFPFLICAIENYLRESVAADLPPKISIRHGHDGKIEVFPANVGPVDISITPLADLSAVQCDTSWHKRQFSFICPRN